MATSGSLWKLYDITIVADGAVTPAAPRPPPPRPVVAAPRPPPLLANVSVEETLTLSGNDATCSIHERVLSIVYPWPMRCAGDISCGGCVNMRDTSITTALSGP